MTTDFASGEQAVPSPGYDRDRLTTGIVHFGLGNFHRAHQALFVDRLMNLGEGFDWGICGVGVLAADAHMRDVLRGQDFLYTLVEKDADGSVEPRVIGSIHEFLFAPDDPGAVIEKLAAESTRIVSLTITEGGYAPPSNLTPADVQVPPTVFDLIAAGLSARRDRGIPPFTIMSCDNIPSNGSIARAAVLRAATDPGLAAWIADTTRFPNSMVDRITPATTDADRALVREGYGLIDAWPVVCEPYLQWVLEDDFPLGRPAFEKVGVQLVNDVEPYELMKLRLLNASHQAMAYFGHLMGYRLAHDAATDPLIRELLRRYMDEASPTLRPVPGIDLAEYKRTLLKRFANPAIRDTIARLAADTSHRIPTWLVPVIEENLAADHSVTVSAAIVASWARYAEGADETGDPIQVVDAVAEALGQIARQYPFTPEAFVDNEALFGRIAAHPEFLRPYPTVLADLHKVGARQSLERLLKGSGATA
ncbi:MAG: mannitol dehydrogenase family protein [Cryobacterium sp.]|nr:mannitol dehydrogenase family protein [Cryobacterium sp.]